MRDTYKNAELTGKQDTGEINEGRSLKERQVSVVTWVGKDRK